MSSGQSIDLKAGEHLLSSRQRFLKSCHCEAVDRPPTWLMRQAGRALPEYRALREKHSFLQLTQTPELAAEVTLQPVRRFGFDAAILFSDILVIPEALGQPYQFRDGGGIAMAFAMKSVSDMTRLRWDRIVEHLRYVSDALKLLRRELGERTALIGFGGSPWTLANFMAEGGSAPSFSKALAWWQSDPAGFEVFLEKLSQALIEYFRMQVEAGVDAIQIFDSLGNLLPVELYERLSTRWIGAIVRAVPPKTPVIVFGRAPQTHLGALIQTGPRVVGLDHTVNPATARETVPATMAIQGNLDPGALLGAPDEVRAATVRLLDTMNGRRGYIFNLGHGLLPATPVDNIAKLVETVRSYKWQN